jgi:Uma2 family endonuclease
MTVLAPSLLRPPADGTLRIERPHRPYTLAEVNVAGDEGSEWWEAEGGVLILNAPPSPRHQRWVSALLMTWHQEAADRRYEVFPGPQRVVIDEHSWLEPDVALWPVGSDLDLAWGRSTPILVAEVASPSTQERDRLTKPGLYARAGVAWLVVADPATVTVELYDLSGEPHLHSRVVGDEPLACPLTGADLTPATIALG